MEQDKTAASPRIFAIDWARGAALVGMALYHLGWDLAYFHLAAPDFPQTIPMRFFSHGVAGAFLFLAGASLSLAHRGGLRRGAFLRRLGVIGAAAAFISAASAFYAPDEPIYFGILHCIAVSSLIAAPLLRAPIWAALALAALAFLAPALIADPHLNAPALVWLGLGSVPPHTLDWRPLTPWSGFVFLGLALTRLNAARLQASPLARRPTSAAARALAWAGRHSLAIYFIHQPIFFAILFAGTSLTGYSARWEAANFVNVCQRECVEGGGAAEACAPACACVVERLRAAGLSNAIARGALNDAEQQNYSRVVQSCAKSR